MTALDFPDTPSTGQLFGSAGTVWRFDGTRWASTAGASGARGRVGYAQSVVTSGPYSTITPVAGVNVTWVADPSRTYRTTVQGTVQSDTAGNYIQMAILNTAGTKINNNGDIAAQGAVGYGLSVQHIESGLSGTQSRHMGIARLLGSGVCQLMGDPSAPAFILVEDITYEAGAQGAGGGGIVFNQSATISTTPTRIEARSTTATPVGSDVGANFAIPFTSPPTVIAICGDGWPFTVIATRSITTTGFICDIIDERTGAKKLDNTGIRYIAIGPG